MLRSIFVIALMIIGVYYALQAPFYALLSYLAYAYFRPEHWLWFNIIPPKFSFILGAYLALRTLLSRPHFIINKPIIFLFVFVLHSFFSILLSGYDKHHSWIAWTNFLNSIVVTYIMVILITDFAKLRTALLILALFLGVEGAKQGWVYLLTSPGSVNTNGIPFLGDNNGVAVGMLMLVPVIAFLAQTAQRRWIRFGFWFLLIGVLFRALSTYSRGGFLACLAMGTAYWLRSRQKLRVLIGLLVVVAIVYPALSDKYWARMDTISVDEESTESSGRSRLHFWRVAVSMANAHPFLGVGSNSYIAAFNQYDFLNGQYGKNRAVHSAYFGVLGETGYIGLVLYLLNLCYAVYNCSRVRKLAARDPGMLALQQCATALESSLIVFIVGSAFLTFQYAEMFWHYIGFTIVLERLATQYALASTHPNEASPEVTMQTVKTSTIPA
ncbi:MAG: putative O-glycosylation ligase, exosortase A system-associated [Candidatus Tectimicrobiota bacterium]